MSQFPRLQNKHTREETKTNKLVPCMTSKCLKLIAAYHNSRCHIMLGFHAGNKPLHFVNTLHCHRISIALPLHCHYIAIALPLHLVITLHFHGIAIALSLPCHCNALTLHFHYILLHHAGIPSFYILMEPI